MYYEFSLVEKSNNTATKVNKSLEILNMYFIRKMLHLLWFKHDM